MNERSEIHVVLVCERPTGTEEEQVCFDVGIGGKFVRQIPQFRGIIERFTYRWSRESPISRYRWSIYRLAAKEIV